MTACNVHWTAEVEAALESEDVDPLVGVERNVLARLEAVVGHVRLSSEERARVMLAALITQLVHERDVVQSFEKEAHAVSLGSYAWLGQMRMYVDALGETTEEDAAVDAKQTALAVTSGSLANTTKRDRRQADMIDIVAWQSNLEPLGQMPVIAVRMVNAVQYIGSEYVGNFNRLVVTPLTERCHRALISNASFGFGSATVGPPSVGRTETIRDLATMISQHCWVFNCGPNTEVSGIVRLLRGISSVGSWLLLNDFDRSPADVLSTAAAHIATVMRAKRDGVQKFVLDGGMFFMRTSCNVLATMTPTKPGRTALPENLSSLFRTIAMIAPDGAAIARTQLLAAGFEKYASLGQKLALTLHTLDSHLSRSPAYNIGFGTLAACIASATNALRSGAVVDEEAALARAIVDVTSAAVLDCDRALYYDVLRDVFGSVATRPDSEALTPLVTAINAACSDLQLGATDSFVAKCIELNSSLNSRRGVFLVGPATTGKSSLLRTLASALYSMCHEAAPRSSYSHASPVPGVRVCVPGALSAGRIFGAAGADREWVDGAVTCALREVASVAARNSSEPAWAVLDCVADDAWLEDMTTLLSGAGTLACTMSMESIVLPPSARVVVETADISHVTPSIVSRYAIVCVQPDMLHWTAVLNRWRDSLPASIAEHASFIVDTVPWVIDAILGISDTPTDSIIMVAGSPVAMALDLLSNVRSVLLEVYAMPTLDAMAAAERAGIRELRQKARAEEDARAAQATTRSQARDLAGGAHAAGGASVLAPSRREEEKARKAEETRLRCERGRCEGIMISAVVAAVGARVFGPRRREWETRLRCAVLVVVGVPRNMSTHSICRQYFSGGATSTGRCAIVALPPLELSIFEAIFNAGTAESGAEGRWEQWNASAAPISLPSSNSELFVQTAETARFFTAAQRAILSRRSVLLVGPRGGAKTTAVRCALVPELTRLAFETLYSAVAASTTPSKLQSTIAGVLTLRRSGSFGPQRVGASLVVVLDDVHLARASADGFSPTELLRQLLGYDGWHSRKGSSEAFRNVEDTQMLLVADSSHDGKSLQVCQRVAAQCAVVGVQASGDTELATIFSCILSRAQSIEQGLYMAASANRAGSTLVPVDAAYVSSLVRATICVARTISSALPPSPAAPQLRICNNDIARVISGLACADARSACIEAALARLWAHECMRVFADRCSNVEGSGAVVLRAVARATSECLGVPLGRAFSRMRKGIMSEAAAMADVSVTPAGLLRAMTLRTIAAAAAASTTWKDFDEADEAAALDAVNSNVFAMYSREGILRNPFECGINRAADSADTILDSFCADSGSKYEVRYHSGILSCAVLVCTYILWRRAECCPLFNCAHALHPYCPHTGAAAAWSRGAALACAVWSEHSCSARRVRCWIQRL